MTSETWALAALATASVILVATVVSFFVGAAAGESRGRHFLVVAAVIAIGCLAGAAMVATMAASSTQLVAAGLGLPLIGMPALGAAILSLPIRRLGLRLPAVLTFVAVATIVVVLPMNWASFTLNGALHAMFDTADLAGALPALCAPSVAALTVLSIEHLGHVRRRSRTNGDDAPIRQPRRRTPVLLIAVTLISWAAWIGWMIGMELALDDVSARIVINGILAPIASASAWLIVQRMRHAATTGNAAITGLVCGLAAISSACGYVDTIGAILTGLIAGAVGSLIAHTLARRHAGAAWLTPVALAVGSTIGVVSIGLFSTRLGLAYTGQPELLFSQAGSVTVTCVYTIAVTSIVWLSLRRLAGRPVPPITT